MKVPESSSDSSPAVTLDPALKSDWPQLSQLLASCGLPLDGLRDHLASVLVARVEGELIGSAAFEFYTKYALLRSVAVAPRYQGQGIGVKLVTAALTQARQGDISHVYLLTETAATFFPKFGFHPIQRADIPSPVKTSVEFTSACPDSALAMVLRLEER